MIMIKLANSYFEL